MEELQESIQALIDSVKFGVNALNQFDSAIWYGVAAMIVTFIFEVFLSSKGLIYSKPEKKMARVRKKGHCVMAHKIDYDPHKELNYRKARYEYVVNGKTYTRWKFADRSQLPDSLYIYYFRNPKKAFWESDLNIGPSVILIYIIPVIIGGIVMMALGYKPPVS